MSEDLKAELEKYVKQLAICDVELQNMRSLPMEDPQKKMKIDLLIKRANALLSEKRRVEGLLNEIRKNQEAKEQKANFKEEVYH